jgi:Carboxypeptidase regulatory-like domain
MRRWTLTLLLMTSLLLVGSCYRKRPSSQVAVPTGYGVLEVLVQDEGGSPIKNASVQIANKAGATATVHTADDGRTKGAGNASEGPFTLGISAPGYATAERSAVTLIEGKTVSIVVKLKKG